MIAAENAKGQAPWLRAGNVAEFYLRVLAYGKTLGSKPNEVLYREGRTDWRGYFCAMNG